MSAIKGRKKTARLNEQPAKLVAVNESSIEMIRERAYELFLARGATHGADLADWFEAEQDLRAASQR
jgi:Protein of unknown function (DUF2934)